MNRLSDTIWIWHGNVLSSTKSCCTNGSSTEDVSIGIALMFFATLLGAAVFVSVGQNVLDNQLVQRLSGFPGFEPDLITEGGATSFLSSLPASLQETGLIEYNEALRRVFQIGLVLSCITTLFLAMMEWKSVLKKVEAEKGSKSDFVPVE